MKKPSGCRRSAWNSCQGAWVGTIDDYGVHVWGHRQILSAGSQA
jgi:hypothetical protein